MSLPIQRRRFLQLATAGGVLCLAQPTRSWASNSPDVISPGAVKSRVQVGLLFLGKPAAHWPTPSMDLEREVGTYHDELTARKADLADVFFATDEIVTAPEQIDALLPRLDKVDGILAVHVSMGINETLKTILALGKPTVLFAKPYSGHEWSHMGRVLEAPEGQLLDCVFSSDLDDLVAAIRPFRAIHHLREAKILDVTTRELPADFCSAMKSKFGTEIVRVSRERVVEAYDAVNAGEAEAVSRRLIRHAAEVVEPSRDEIARSCRLALAFEQLAAEEQATAITVDCYGSMYRQLPAFPCVGFTRLNDMGLAGICESDLASAMTFMMIQSLSGRPGFISDPTVDESKDTIILAHCLGSTRMHGPDGPACSYKLRSIMERQEGAVMHVKMPRGEKVTQAIFVGADKLLYFTGDAIGSPDTERGCRTKIEVKVDGDARTLWHNWSAGLHRVTCYGDLRPDLTRFCRFKGIEMVDEARPKGESV